MTGTKEIRCRCGKRYSVSVRRNADLVFVCPECAERQAAINRKHRKLNPDDYQVTVTLLDGTRLFYQLISSDSNLRRGNGVHSEP